MNKVINAITWLIGSIPLYPGVVLSLISSTALMAYLQMEVVSLPCFNSTDYNN